MAKKGKKNVTIHNQQWIVAVGEEITWKGFGGFGMH